VVEAHARQFDTDVPERDPGSQEELAAASYILGHLQQAGYVPLLDSVPVGDLVESTNVVALPVSGDEAETLVAVAYGTTGTGSGSEAIGAFLELARALNVLDPGHSVAFVAIADAGQVSPRLEGTLGTRRLLRYLADQGLTPHVITLEGAPQLSASGSRASEIIDSAGAGRVEEGMREDLFARVRLEHTDVAGPAATVGAALLEYLGD